MFGTAQPLLLSSQPFDVVLNLRGATRVANGLQRLRCLQCPPVRTRRGFITWMNFLLTRISAFGIQTNGSEAAIPGVKAGKRKSFLTFLMQSDVGEIHFLRQNEAFRPPLAFQVNPPPSWRSRTNRTRGGFWYSVIWLLLFEQGHFPEKLQMKDSIILLQRHFRKDSSSVISYIVFNSPSSFF